MLQSRAFGALIAALAISTTAIARADSTADLNKYAAAMARVHSYRSFAQTQMGRVTSEVVKPNRFHVTMFNGLEFIVIGGASWVKANGRWMRGHADLRWITANGPPLGDFNRDFKVTDIGMQGALHVYQLAREGEETTLLYLRPDFLPAKLEQTVEGQTTTITYFDFNKLIVIKPPK